jgi:hypothetical protein
MQRVVDRDVYPVSRRVEVMCGAAGNDRFPGIEGCFNHLVSAEKDDVADTRCATIVISLRVQCH